MPLAAVLWSGGISFAGVLAFLFADLIVLPIVAIYRKYYGSAFTVRIIALMLLTMVLAALLVDGVFSVLGLIPTGPRPTRGDVFGSVGLDYKFVLNLLGLVVFAALMGLRRGAGRRRRPAPSTTTRGGVAAGCGWICRRRRVDLPPGGRSAGGAQVRTRPHSLGERRFMRA